MKKIFISLLWLFFFFLLGYVFHFIASEKSLYFYILWLDMPMHFLGGCWLALFVLYFFQKKITPVDSLKKAKIVVFIALVVAVCVGSIWEVRERFEFDSSTFIQITRVNKSVDIKDTVSDIFFDGLGACFGAGLFILRKRRRA